MSDTKHTPTPWGLCHHLKSPEHDASCQCGYRGSIWSAEGDYIVLEMGSSPDHDGDGKLMGHTMPQADRATQLADAAFIVTAVNAYDSHVSRIEALERENAWLRLAMTPVASVALAAGSVWLDTETVDRLPHVGSILKLGYLRNVAAALMDAKERKE